MIRSVLMVCEGNICRSPMAAALLDRELGGGIDIVSAGTAALDGRPADAHAIELMHERGIDLTRHVARTVSLPLMRAHDLVLVMTLAQRDWLLQHYPFARGRVFRLLHGAGRDVADPFSQGRVAFAASLAQIESGVADWADTLRNALRVPAPHDSSLTL